MEQVWEPPESDAERRELWFCPWTNRYSHRTLLDRVSQFWHLSWVLMLSTRFGFGTSQLVNVRHGTQQGSRDHAKSRANVENPVTYEPESIRKGDRFSEGTQNPFLDGQMNMSSSTFFRHTFHAFLGNIDQSQVQAWDEKSCIVHVTFAPAVDFLNSVADNSSKEKREGSGNSPHGVHLRVLLFRQQQGAEQFVAFGDPALRCIDSFLQSIMKTATG